MRGADKLVSMKEDIDAMSWSRVTEIAKLLQEDHTEEQRHEWARELQSIARTNSWVLDKFGVAADDMTGQVIPSGIEMQQHDRYLSETTAAEIPSAGEGVSVGAAPVEAAPSPEPEPDPAVAATRSEAVPSPEPEPAVAATRSEGAEVPEPAVDTARSESAEVPEAEWFAAADRSGAASDLDAVQGQIAGVPEAASDSAATSSASGESLESEPVADARIEVFAEAPESRTEALSDESEPDGGTLADAPDSSGLYYAVVSLRESKDWPEPSAPAAGDGSSEDSPVHEACDEPTAASSDDPTGEIPRIRNLDLPTIEPELPLESLSDAEAELRALEALYDSLVAQGEQQQAQAEPEKEDRAGEQPQSQVQPECEVRAGEQQQQQQAEPDQESPAKPESNPQPEPSEEPRSEPQPERQSESGCERAQTPSPRHASKDDAIIETRGVLKKKRRLDKQKRRDRRDAAVFSIPMGKPVEDHPLPAQEEMQVQEPVASSCAPVPEPIGNEVLPGAEPASRPDASDAAIDSTSAGGGTSVEVDAGLPRSDGGSVDTETAAECSSSPECPDAYQEAQITQDFARFKHVYSNKKGSLCLYQDADGHLVAVDPSRFA